MPAGVATGRRGFGWASIVVPRPPVGGHVGRVRTACDGGAAHRDASGRDRTAPVTVGTADEPSASARRAAGRWPVGGRSSAARAGTVGAGRPGACWQHDPT
ncbi:hypothetical protein WY02_24395 [Pseudonocardia sp. AL041005-10]|nr:hypothetical protein WY02_24395 [Pseudonocardia sp. AL041005-10]